MSRRLAEKVAPYILAGGRSSRMGRDKAMIGFGGMTLLARAVETLKSVEYLGPLDIGARVTVVGDRTILEGADRSIPDRYPGCGPLGGMEAALNDLNETGAAEWAFFLPVDMPFLPAGLIDGLLAQWTAAVQAGARVCHVVVDERPQPLISLVHRELHPYVVAALQGARHKVSPVLKAACIALAQADTALPSCRPGVFESVFRTRIEDVPLRAPDSTWSATEEQLRLRPMWFVNLNSQDDLNEAETLCAGVGSVDKREIVPN